LRAGCRLGAEFSKANGVAVEVGDDIAVGLRFQRDENRSAGPKWPAV